MPNVTVVDGSGQQKDAVYATGQDFTLYVRTTGDDSNDGLTAATAMATPQAAIDKIPSEVKHVVNINVGPGTFPGFVVSGKHIDNKNGKLFVTGTLGNWEPGPPATVYSSLSRKFDQSVLTGGPWFTVDELKGKLVNIDGTYRRCIANSNITIWYAFLDSIPPLTGAVIIEEEKTFLTPVAGFGIRVEGMLNSNRNNFAIKNFKVDAVGTAYGVFARGSFAIKFQNVSVWYTTPNWAYGFWCVGLKSSDFLECYCDQADSAYLLDNTLVGVGRFYADHPANTHDKLGLWAYHGSGGDDISLYFYGVDGIAVKMEGCWKMWIDAVIIETGAGDGLQLIGTDAEIIYMSIYDIGGDGLVLGGETGYGSPANVVLTEAYIDNIRNGVILGPNSTLHLVDYVGAYTAVADGWVVGAGAVLTSKVGIDGDSCGGYGLRVNDGGLVMFATDAWFDNNVTGAINLDGTVALTMAADFASDGDSAINAATGSRVARRDSL